MLLSSLLVICPLLTVPAHAFFFISSWGTTNRLGLPMIDRNRNTCSVNVGGKSIQGINVDGGCRYTVRYGDAKRWNSSQVASSIGTKFNTLPPACPQKRGEYSDGYTQSEDCLFATIYTPLHVAPNANLPVFTWIHGGSFDSGSASAPGLSGSRIAQERNIIVVVLQYRLGVLGYLPPSSAPSAKDPNLGVGDIVLALRWLRNAAKDFGGDGGRVVLGGQSSGAHMIRGRSSSFRRVTLMMALWATPAARGFFRGAILQSDPMFYGLAPHAITAALTKSFYATPEIAKCTTLDCLRQLQPDVIIAAQSKLLDTAPYTIPGVPLGEPIRPSFGFPSIPSDPTTLLFSSPNRLSSPPNQLPVLIASTANEAGQIIDALFPTPIPASNSTLLSTLSFLMGEERAAALVVSGKYHLGSGGDTFRETLEKIVTDGIWRCPARQVGREWARGGGKVWVGEWTKGRTYASNQGGGYCSSNGRVCHEDDILPTFGAGPNDLTREVTSAWMSFIKTFDPNTGDKRWNAFTATSGVSDVKGLGGGQVIDCPGDFWGKDIEYDWQVYT